MGISTLLRPLRQRTFLITCLGIAIALPCLDALCAYLSGWGSMNFGFAFLLLLPTLASGPILAFIFLLRSLNLKERPPLFWPGVSGAAVLLFSLPCVLSLFLGPMMALFGEGFADRINSRAPLDELQTWAVDVLARHERGELKTKKEQGFASMSVLADEEVPDSVQTLGSTPPEVMVHKAPSYGCPLVDISWRLYGVLISAPDSQPNGRFFYLRQLRPGVYVYVREK